MANVPGAISLRVWGVQVVEFASRLAKMRPTLLKIGKKSTYDDLLLNLCVRYQRNCKYEYLVIPSDGLTSYFTSKKSFAPEPRGRRSRCGDAGQAKCEVPRSRIEAQLGLNMIDEHTIYIPVKFCCDWNSFSNRTIIKCSNCAD